MDPAERTAQRTTEDAGAAAPRAYPDLASALVATIPADARVIGFGELHARRDHPAATSMLAAFTVVILPPAALPSGASG